MLKLLRHPFAAQAGSATLVWIVGVLVGRQAALGMDTQQWMAGSAAVAGSILVAILVRTAPTPQRARAGNRSER